VKKRPFPPALRRSLYLRRRPLAAASAFLAVLAALLVLSPGAEERVTVYAARTNLPAGTVLAEEHLAPLDLPPEAVPEGAAVAPGDVVGRTLAGSVSARSALTAASVSGAQRLASPGHVVLALPVADEAIAGLVRPGVLIDVIDAAGEVLASGIPVLSPPDTPSGGNLSLGGPSRSVLVEVPEPVAARLASQGLSTVTIVVR